MSTNPTMHCPICGTAYAWRFWDGDDGNGGITGGMETFCPTCEDRDWHPTVWGQRTRAQRITQRISFRTMSERTGIPVVRISDIEAGYGDPPTEDEMRRIDAELAGLPAREER